MSATCPTYFTTIPNPDIITSGDADVKACLGVGLDLTTWITRLNASPSSGATPCVEVFDGYIRGGGGIRTFDPIAFAKLQDGMVYAFASIFSDGSSPGSKGVFKMVYPDQDGYTPAQDALLTICVDESVAGICNKAQAAMCTTCTRTDVVQYKPVLQFCGCFVPADPLTIQNDVPPECDPLCAQAQIIKKADASTGNPTICNRTVCVINDISITATNSILQTVSFTQVCPECIAAIGSPDQSSSCLCIIDASIPGIGKTLSIDNPLTFNQYCGPQSICTQVDNTAGTIKQVPCAETLSSLTPNTYSFSIPGWVWLTAIAILVVGTLVALSVMYANRHRITIQRSEPFKLQTDNVKGLKSTTFRS